MPTYAATGPWLVDAVERHFGREGFDEGEQVCRRFGVAELDREHCVADDRCHPDVVDRDLAEAGRQAFTQDVACDVVASDRGADDAVRELERNDAGVVVRGLFDEGEQLLVAAARTCR